MTRWQILLIPVVVAILLIVLGQPFFILTEAEQAVVTQFGQPVSGAIRDAGIHFKIPFIQVVHRLEKRILEWDGDPTKNPTKDKRFIWVDLTARWKVVDPLKFLQTVNNEFQAQRRLDDILESQTKTIVSGQPLIEIVRSSNRKMAVEIFDDSGDQNSKRIVQIQYGREALTREILERAIPIVQQYGIELVDIRIKRINYTAEVRDKIYERMIAERKRAAERFRSEGQGRKAEIEGRTQKELQRIRSEAYRKSQEIRGAADATASEIYANAYAKDPDFYNFLKTLDTYKKTVDRQSTLILSTDSDYFKYLKSVQPKPTE